MSRQFDDAFEERRDQKIAAALDIEPEVLAEYPFSLDEEASDDGHPYSFRLEWESEAPPGVSTYGDVGQLWSTIPLSALASPQYDEQEYDELMSQPVTRAELVAAMQAIYTTAIAQTAFNASVFQRNEPNMQKDGLRVSECAGSLVELTQKFLRDWEDGSNGGG